MKTLEHNPRLSNFNIELQKAHEAETDWKFGATSQPSIVAIPEAERDQYLPAGETQFTNHDDFYDCATRSPVNEAEALFTYHYRHGMKPENKKWMLEKGYVAMRDGLPWVEFSDRFISILAGTTRAGNSLKMPLETIRTRGLIPKSLLPKGDMDSTFEDYYHRENLTAAMLDLGLEWMKRFQTNYDQVGRGLFKETLVKEMIGVAGYAWKKPIKGIYKKVDPEEGYNHAFLLYKNPAFQAFDNYYDYTDDGTQVVGDFTKNLASDYSFYEWGYRFFVSKEMSAAHVFLKNLYLGNTDSEVAYLQQALLDLGYNIPHAVTQTFGGETQAALRAFQMSQGILDDGSNFGPRTRAAMNARLNPPKSGIEIFFAAVQKFINAFYKN